MMSVTLPTNFRSDVGNLVTCSLENSATVVETVEEVEVESTVWTKSADLYCVHGDN